MNDSTAASQAPQREDYGPERPRPRWVFHYDQLEDALLEHCGPEDTRTDVDRQTYQAIKHFLMSKILEERGMRQQ